MGEAPMTSRLRAPLRRIRSHPWPWTVSLALEPSPFFEVLEEAPRIGGVEARALEDDSSRMEDLLEVAAAGRRGGAAACPRRTGLFRPWRRTTCRRIRR